MTSVFFWNAKKKGYQLYVINPFNLKTSLQTLYIVPFYSLCSAKAEISNKCKQKKNTKKSSMKKKTDQKKETIPFHGQRLCKPRYFRRIYCESTIPDYVIPGVPGYFNPGLFNLKG